MKEYIQPRQTGKTTAIATEVNWCAMFDMLPVVVIFPTTLMKRNFDYIHLKPLGITETERKKIHLIVGAREWKNAFTSDIFSQIKCAKPVRIYIDEVQCLHAEFIKELQSKYDNIMYVYGTHWVVQHYRGGVNAT